jgi:hypothetical protein
MEASGGTWSFWLPPRACCGRLGLCRAAPHRAPGSDHSSLPPAHQLFNMLENLLFSQSVELSLKVYQFTWLVSCTYDCPVPCLAGFCVFGPLRRKGSWVPGRWYTLLPPPPTAPSPPQGREQHCQGRGCVVSHD